ncbi:hypothetical protein HK104_005075 [Borealophlyctis nickersoniae]|nr:hypothetical protein HK104_005075 [Borealophlyctis nickersoniae]
MTSTCAGCQQSIDESDTTLNLINFSDNLYHVECFNCCKCGQPIDYEGSVVLLSEDGKSFVKDKGKQICLTLAHLKALCVGCSYKCKACSQPILEEAITTGNDTYHLGCFRCSSCNRQIEELTFANINNRLLCMQCHQGQPPSPISPQTPSSFTLPNSGLKSGTMTPSSRDGSRYSSTVERSETSSVRNGDITYIQTLEKELFEMRRKYLETDENLQKVKAISRKALEEFSQLREEHQEEIHRRQQAEAVAEHLQSELQRLFMDEAKRAQLAEETETMHRELEGMLQRRETLERGVAELTRHKDSLAFEVQELLQRKHLGLVEPNHNQHPQTSSSSDDLRSQLDQIKERFRDEIAVIQRDRDALHAEVTLMRTTRQELASDIARLAEENRALELRNEQITKQIVTSAESIASEPLASPREEGVYPNMNELVRSISNDDNGGGVSSSSRGSISEPSRRDKELPPRPPHIKLHGPRKDDKIGVGVESGGGIGTAQKKPGWGKHWTSNMAKATATKLKKAIPTGGREGGSGATLVSQKSDSTSSFKYGNKKASKSDLDLKKLDSKTHSFSPHAYMSPRKCDFCHEKLWGKETRCDGCGYHCHQKCASSVSSICENKTSSIGMLAPPGTEISSSNQVGGAVFGQDIGKLLESEGGDVPLIMQKCINSVELRGMDFEGIYRKSGPLTQINRIIASVNRGEDVNLEDEQNYVDIMAVTSILKQYLRDLPDPLIPMHLYEEYLETTRIEDESERMKLTLSLIEKLPKPHLTTLSHLMRHLSRIEQLSSKNLMTPSNLGVVFGPTLMRPLTQKTPEADMAEAGLKSNVVEFLVKNANELFSDEGSRDEEVRDPEGGEEGHAGASRGGVEVGEESQD